MAAMLQLVTRTIEILLTLHCTWNLVDVVVKPGMELNISMHSHTLHAIELQIELLLFAVIST